MIATGRTLTVGELRELLDSLHDNDTVMIAPMFSGDDEPMEILSAEVVGGVVLLDHEQVYDPGPSEDLVHRIAEGEIKKLADIRSAAQQITGVRAA